MADRMRRRQCLSDLQCELSGCPMLKHCSGSQFLAKRGKQDTRIRLPYSRRRPMGCAKRDGMCKTRWNGIGRHNRESVNDVWKEEEGVVEEQWYQEPVSFGTTIELLQITSKVRKNPTKAHLFSSSLLSSPNHIPPPRQLLAQFITRCCDGGSEMGLEYRMAVGSHVFPVTVHLDV
ncbi:hypothetical protein C8J56DRAFT_888932 [Mycena floridula]|nr:hypothetical protein C8J56DRAFT_888932 [Mycena floridula]